MTKIELIVDRQLSAEEVEKIYDIIAEHVHVERKVTLNESENCVEIDVEIQVMQEGSQFEYTLPLTNHTSDEEYESIVQGIAKIIPDDFEFGVFTPQ